MHGCNVILLSDLHMELDKPPNEFKLPDVPRDILLLLGDINIGTKADEFILQQLAYGDVIYVLGNHEFYKQILPALRIAWNTKTKQRINNQAKSLGYSGTLYVLDDSTVTLHNITFIGSTLWTNFAGGNPISMMQAQSGMNDYKWIYSEIDSCMYPRKLPILPDDTLRLHNRSRYFIETELKKPGKKVFLSHHLPSYRSIPEKFRGDPLNPSYASNLDDLFYDNTDIILAAHGHTHDSMDYQIESTRVICNPRGYAHERNPAFNPTLTIPLE